MPVMRQVFIGSADARTSASFERKLFVIRKWAENTVRESDLEERGAFLHPEPVVAHRSSTRACCSPSSSAASTAI